MPETNQPSPLFTVVGQEHEAPPQKSKEQIVAEKMLLMALSALSQRFVVALASTFTLLTIGSAFFLWTMIPDPNNKQLVALGMYAVLVLAINVIVRRLK